MPLNAQAKRILDRQPRTESLFVFSSPLDPSRPRSCQLSIWDRVREEAGIEDVRLHDLRHTHASHAVMNGVPVPVVSRMLGHSNVRMTLRYAHLGDREIEAEAERIGEAIAAMMELWGGAMPPSVPGEWAMPVSWRPCVGDRDQSTAGGPCPSRRS